MNYYNPSFYPSYNGNIQMPPSQYYFNQQPQQVMNNPSASGLNGKLVDSEDMARVTEVPIGGYGIFPKADLSEIYIKSWNNNGTTNIITFKPDTSQPMAEQNPIDVILERINQLESKIDNVIKIPETTPQEVTPIVEQPKKEVSANAY